MAKKQNKKFFKKDIYLKTFIFGVFMSALLTPFFAYAQTYSQDLFGLFEYAKDIIDDIVLWLIVTGAVIFFIFNLVKYIWSIGSGKDKDANDAKKFIMYGLIALTVMFSFYAISALLAVTFGIQIGVPQFFGEQTTLTPGSGQVQRSYSIIR